MKRQGRSSEVGSYLSTSKLQALNRIIKEGGGGGGDSELQNIDFYNTKRKEKHWDSCPNKL